MKTLEYIDSAFCIDIPIDSLVRLVLERGQDVEYDEKLKIISIRSAKKKNIELPQYELVGRFKEYSDLGDTGNASLEFVTDEEYCFTLNSGQIADYKVIE